MIKVLFFGPVAEKIGSSQLEIDFQPGLRLQDLRAHLQTKYPEAFALVSIVAIDGNQVRDLNIELTNQSEIVFMSKFSGG